MIIQWALQAIAAVSIIGMLVTVFATGALILKKAGFSMVWAVLAPIPVVNCVALIVLAVVEWPIERELASLRSSSYRKGDSQIESEWELKMILKKALTLEKGGQYQEAIAQFEQFIQRTKDQQNAAVAREHIDRIRAI